MWNKKRSLLLSRIFTLTFMAALAAIAVSAPWLFERLLFLSRAGLGGLRVYFLITTYSGAVVAAVLLVALYLVLCRIANGQVFVEKNVRGLRLISWCCFLGAILAAVSAVYYYPWSFLAIAAAFMGLIVRIIKNVFAEAVALQDEVDYTV